MQNGGTLHSFLASTLHGHEWLPSRSARGRRHRCPWNAKLGWLQDRSERSWRRVCGPYQDLHSEASSSHPLHDTDHAIPTTLVEILAKHMIFCLNLGLMYFLYVCQFNSMSICIAHGAGTFSKIYEYVYMYNVSVTPKFYLINN